MGSLLHNRELRKLRRLLKRKRHYQIELCMQFYPCWSRFKKIGEVHFCLFGTKGPQVKARNERFRAAGWRCSQNLKYETRQNKYSEPMKIYRRLQIHHTKFQY